MKETIQFTLTPDHVVAAVQRNSERGMQRTHTRILCWILGTATMAGLGLIAGYSLTGWFSTGGGTDPLLGIAAVVAIASVILAGFAQRQGVFLLVRKSPLLVGEWSLGLHEDGVWLKSPHGESFTRWSGWRDVEEYGDLLLLLQDDFHGHPVPFSAFASEPERWEFVEYAKARITNAGSSGQVRVPSSSASGPSETLLEVLQSRRATNFVRNAFRLAFFRRVPADELDATWMQIVGVLLVSILIPTVYAVLTVGANGHVDWMELPGILFHLPLMLLGAILLAAVARGARVSQVLLAALIAWCAIDAVILSLYFALEKAGGGPRWLSWALFYLPPLWMSCAVVRFVLSLSPAPPSRRFAVAAISLAVLAAPLASVYHERSIWTKDYERGDASARTEVSQAMAAASEESFYRQPGLLQDELKAVKPGRKGIVDLYFVGMAGYGHQDVFMKEVNSVATLFQERFQADGHVVKLINNPKTVLTAPVASATSLRAALNHVGETMDKDEDVLVLFLTSHGSSKHEFSLELWPLQFKQITPEMLREILDGSGIKNRVVIVSACYAGGFISQLQNDNTLVIAAAAPDKNSFGCSNETEWTYFGKAYFDEALRKTTSFTQAFELAKPMIEEREKKDHYDPSNPQMFVGPAIKAKLETFERQLAESNAAGRSVVAERPSH